MKSLKQLSLTKIANTILDSPPDINDMIFQEIDLVNSNRMKEHNEDQLKMIPNITRSILQDIIFSSFNRSECEQRYISIDKNVLNAVIESVFKLIDDLKSFNLLNNNIFDVSDDESNSDTDNSEFY